MTLPNPALSTFRRAGGPSAFLTRSSVRRAPRSGASQGLAEPIRLACAREGAEAEHPFRNPDAFADLVLRHQRAVYDAAFRILGHEEDALDCVQETFLRAFRAIDRFREESSLRTWLIRIAINTARSLSARARAKKRMGPGRRLRIDLSGSGAESTGVEIPDSSAEPSRALERRELGVAIESAIAQLEPDARAIIVLRDIVGESYDSIATSVGLPVGTVKSKVHRARVVLRGQLVEHV